MVIRVPESSIRREDGNILIETHTAVVETPHMTYQLQEHGGGNCLLSVQVALAENSSSLPSPILTHDPRDVARMLIADLDEGKTNSYCDRFSDYFVLAEETNLSNSLSVSIVEEREGLDPGDYHYSVYVSEGFIEDEENESLLSTDDLTEDSLVKLLTSIQKETVEEWQAKRH